MNVMKPMYLFSILCVFSALTSCGSGGGGGGGAPATNAVPTGYYGNNGTATVNNGAVTISDLQGMISGTRFIMMSVAQKLVYDGTITVSGNSYNGSVAIYQNGVKLATEMVDGMINQGSTVSAVVAGAGIGSGSFTLNYAASNSTAASVARIDESLANPSWSSPVGDSLTSFSFLISSGTSSITSESAATDGVTFRLCDVAGGSITPITGASLYSVQVEISGCNPTTTANTVGVERYTGLAASQTTTDDVLVLVMTHTSGAYSIGGDFR